MNGHEEAVADSLIEQQIRLFRFTAGEKARLLSILKTMEEELVELLFYSGKPLTDARREAQAALLKECQAVIADSYGEVSDSALDNLGGVAQVEAADTAAAIGTAFQGAIKPGLPTETYLRKLVGNTLIDGAPSADWWRGQKADTQLKFERAMRQGLAASETNAQLIARLRRDVMPTARNNASAQVQTSAAAVASAARMETFQKNDDVVKGYQQLSTLDSHTTFICVSYSGKKWDLNRDPIGHGLPFISPKGSTSGTPRHWNCRSLISVLLKTFKELGIDLPEFQASTRAASGGPVSAVMSFDQFLTRKGPAYADELLGKGRAQLWRDGTITLSQLLDQTGRPLTLAQLRRKYE